MISIDQGVCAKMTELCLKDRSLSHTVAEFVRYANTTRRKVYMILQHRSTPFTRTGGMRYRTGYRYALREEIAGLSR